jgi:hypothetical protein
MLNDSVSMSCPKQKVYKDRKQISAYLGLECKGREHRSKIGMRAFGGDVLKFILVTVTQFSLSLSLSIYIYIYIKNMELYTLSGKTFMNYISINF